MTPTGTLTKKIHSQPARSRRTPPSSGPTKVATPAVAPHRAIAVPRLDDGNVRVITAIVWGVIKDAPKPWITRANTRPSIEPVSPHHSEDTVKIAIGSLKDQTGYAVLEGGKWKVADETLCGLVSLAGTPPPACKS